MRTGRETVLVNVAAGAVGKWNQTYGWIPIMAGFLAFATAFSSGANSLPVPFSTVVASGALTLLQASVVASLIGTPGAAFASNSTIHSLFPHVLKETQPSEGLLMWSLVTVLITATIWLALATYLELPVSSQQSIQSALMGTMLVTRTKGFHVYYSSGEGKFKKFNGVGLLRVVLEWTLGPAIAFVTAFCFFRFLKIAVLRQENSEKRVLIFLPFYYGISAGLLCLFIQYQVISHIVTPEPWETAVAVILATLIGALLSLFVVVPLARKRLTGAERTSVNKRNRSWKSTSKENINQDTGGGEESEEEKFESTLRQYMEMRVLDTVYEEDEQNSASPSTNPDANQVSSMSNSVTLQSTPFKQLLESTPNHLVQTRDFQRVGKTPVTENLHDFFRNVKNFTFSTDSAEYDRHTLIRHALAEKFDDKMEDLFRFPHLLAACTFLLFQLANEIATVVGPFEAIANIFKHRHNYSGNGEYLGVIQVRWWVRGVAGLGASMGFFLCGWRLTQSLGGRVTYPSNSRGLSSQLCAVAAIVMVARMKLPVSGTHSSVGSLVGVGMADDPRNVNWKLLLRYISGWVAGIFICCLVAYGIYSFTIYSPAYVVP